MKSPTFTGCHHECLQGICHYNECLVPWRLIEFEKEYRQLTYEEMVEYTAGGERQKAVTDSIKKEINDWKARTREQKDATIQMRYQYRLKQEERKRRLLGLGLCVICGKRAHRPGKRSCEYCAEKMRQKSRNRGREKKEKEMIE